MMMMTVIQTKEALISSLKIETQRHASLLCYNLIENTFFSLSLMNRRNQTESVSIFFPKEPYFIFYLHTLFGCFDVFIVQMSQHMRKRYLSHRRPAKSQASLCMSTVPPEPLLVTGMSLKPCGSSRRKRMSVPQIGDCACAFEEPHTGKNIGSFFVCRLTFGMS